MGATITLIVVGALMGGGLLAVLSRKWRLPAVESSALIMLASVGAAGGVFALLQVSHDLHRALLPVAVVAGQAALYVGALLLRFHRDPERAQPADPHAVLSPADGTVIYVRRLAPTAVLQVEKRGAVMGLDELRPTALAQQPLWQIGISMVFTDVHVNRAPIAGRVTVLQRRPGSFLSLRRPEAAGRNERQTMVIAGEGAQVALAQVASRLVRRIEAYVREGDPVERGQRIGIIRFGSQVDLFLPVGLCEEPTVAPDQRVRAGETIVSRMKVGR